LKNPIFALPKREIPGLGLRIVIGMVREEIKYSPLVLPIAIGMVREENTTFPFSSVG
jgi:hypothetical protein